MEKETKKTTLDKLVKTRARERVNKDIADLVRYVNRGPTLLKQLKVQLISGDKFYTVVTIVNYPYLFRKNMAQDLETLQMKYEKEELEKILNKIEFKRKK